MYIFRAFAIALASFIGSDSFAQTPTNTMTVSIDGAEMVMLMSPEFTRAQSGWSTVPVPEGGPVDFVDEINAIGYVMDGNAVPMIVYVYLNVWSVGGELRIEQPSIDITVAGDTGRWVTGEDEAPEITLKTYDRTETGVLVEAEFSGDPVYWATVYKKPEDRGPAKTVNGQFSIFFPIE